MNNGSQGMVDVSDGSDDAKLPDSVKIVDRQEKKEYKPHEFRPKSHKDAGKGNFFLRQYDRNYKKLLIIPVVAFIISLAILFSSYSSTGEFFQKDVSIKGGVTVTVLQNYENLGELESFLADELSSTVNARRLSEAGVAKGIVIDAGIETDAEVERFVSLIQERTGVADESQYSIQVIGSALGASFFSQVITSIIIAFALMAVVVFIYFRFALGKWIWLPSIFIIWTVFVDIISTLSIISLLQVKVSTAGLAAFLLLIGYSVDTDILLTMRMMKGRHEKLFDRVMSAARTGVFMTLAGMTAVIVGLIITQSETIRQIMLILAIGLAFDLLHTWITNTGILRWYMERNRYEG